MILFINASSINIVTNKGKKQQVLSPTSSSPLSSTSSHGVDKFKLSGNGTDDEKINAKLDKIYNDGLQRVAKFENIKKPLYVASNSIG